LVGPVGAKIPFQILQNGRIAVRTDLPANSTRTWKVLSGLAPAAPGESVSVTRGPDYYEITNGAVLPSRANQMASSSSRLPLAWLIQAEFSA
jgi:hypothetical protein